MDQELRIPADKCSKRVLLMVLAKVQDEGITVGEAFARLLDNVSEKSLPAENGPFHPQPNDIGDDNCE